MKYLIIPRWLVTYSSFRGFMENANAQTNQVTLISIWNREVTYCAAPNLYEDVITSLTDVNKSLYCVT